jgi:hypothetical protein
VARFGVGLRYAGAFMGDHPDAQPTPSPVQAPEGRRPRRRRFSNGRVSTRQCGVRQPASVCVSPFREQPIPESEWVVVDRSASHPFWSADGRLLYYIPTGTNPLIRTAVRARHFVSESGLAEGEPIAVYASTEMLMPAYLPGPRQS